MEKNNEKMGNDELPELNSADVLESSVLTALYHFVETKQKSDDITSRLLLNLYQDVAEIKKAIGASQEKPEPVGSISNDPNEKQQANPYQQLIESLMGGNGGNQ